jgi:predicted AlkP superfamily phosphohydrolase/phosphomutase
MVHRDPRVASVIPGELRDVENSHLEATLRLLDRGYPDLLAYVITVTDRIQHPFWALYEPEAYPPDFPVPAGLEGRDPVVDAWLQADEVFGRLLDRIPDEALVAVVSDHGFRAAPEEGKGEHRLEGIWAMRGPMIAPTHEPLVMSVVDLLPTLLHLAGAPVAEDFDGRPALEPTAPQDVQTVATYRGEGGGARRTIGASREDQLRSLGYLE